MQRQPVGPHHVQVHVPVKADCAFRCGAVQLAHLHPPLGAAALDRVLGARDVVAEDGLREPLEPEARLCVRGHPEGGRQLCRSAVVQHAVCLHLGHRGAGQKVVEREAVVAEPADARKAALPVNGERAAQLLLIALRVDVRLGGIRSSIVRGCLVRPCLNGARASAASTHTFPRLSTGGSTGGGRAQSRSKAAACAIVALCVVAAATAGAFVAGCELRRRDAWPVMCTVPESSHRSVTGRSARRTSRAWGRISVSTHSSVPSQKSAARSPRARHALRMSTAPSLLP
eukprot:3799085-Prymnesium_polylepis.2